MYDDDTQNIMLKVMKVIKKGKNFMKMMMPNNVKKVKKYRDKIPLFLKKN